MDEGGGRKISEVETEIVQLRQKMLNFYLFVFLLQQMLIFHRILQFDWNKKSFENENKTQKAILARVTFSQISNYFFMLLYRSERGLDWSAKFYLRYFQYYFSSQRTVKKIEYSKQAVLIFRDIIFQDKNCW